LLKKQWVNTEQDGSAARYWRHYKDMKQIAEIELERLWEDKGWRLSANEPLTFPHITLPQLDFY
jgi:hypothetical protein